MKKLFLLFITATLALSITAQNANLKLNLEKNKTYRFKSVSNQNVSQTTNGVEQTTTSSSTTVMSLKMMDTGAGFIVAEARFDSILSNSNAMGQKVDINSGSEGNISSEQAGEVMSAIMNRLSKNPLYVKINETGKVTEVVNLAMIHDIILKDTGAISAKLAPMLKTQIKNAVTHDALRKMVDMFTYNLPAKQVKSGDQWNISELINAGGMSLDIATNYKLNNINNNVATITAESTVKAAANAAPIEYPGAKITYEGLNGIGKSNMTLSTVTGLVIDNTTKSNISGDLNVNAPGMTMQIPMKIISEATIKSIQ